MIQALTDDLKRHEGLRLFPYRDTVGKLTIGIGRNLDDNGITEVEAMFMLGTDVKNVVNELDINLAWWTDLDTVRRRALANMAFNMGVPRLLQFKNMLDALQRGSYEIAAMEALDSLWAQQVGKRSQDIAKMIETGKEPE